MKNRLIMLQIDIDRIVKVILLFLLFFPSITFGIFTEVEIFPWALIFSLVYFYRIKDKLFIILLFFLPWIFHLLVTDITNFEGYRSVLAILNAVLIFFVIITLNKNEMKDLYFFIKLALTTMLSIGLFQYYFDINSLETLTQFLTPRAKTGPDNVGITQRGVSAFSTEQGRAGLEIVLLWTIIAFKNIKKIKKVITLSLLILFYLILINKSLTSAFMLFILLFCIALHMTKLKPNKLISLFLVCISFFVGVWFTFKYLPPEIYNLSRITAVLHDLTINSPKRILIGIYEHAGARVSSQLAIYFEVTMFGNGLGKAKDAVVYGIINNPILTCCEHNWYNYHPLDSRHRPMSFLSGLIAEQGIIGGLSFIIFLSSCFLNRVSLVLKRSAIIFSLVPIFSIFFLGSTGSPIVFICLAVIASREYLES